MFRRFECHFSLQTPCTRAVDLRSTPRADCQRNTSHRSRPSSFHLLSYLVANILYQICCFNSSDYLTQEAIAAQCCNRFFGLFSSFNELVQRGRNYHIRAEELFEERCKLYQHRTRVRAHYSSNSLRISASIVPFFAYSRVSQRRILFFSMRISSPNPRM